MKKIILIIFLCWLLVQTGFSQEVGIAYYQTINRAEEFILQEDFPKAVAIYDSLLAVWQADIPFVKEYYVAAQLCAGMKDYNKVNKFLLPAIQRGLSMESIRIRKYLADYRKSSQFKALSSLYDSLHSVYMESVDWGYRNKIDSMYDKDQEVRNLLRKKGRTPEITTIWHKTDSLNKILLFRLIGEKGIPSEKNIGLNKGRGIICSSPMILLLHYASDDGFNDILPMLYEEAYKGNIHLDRVARMEDYRLFPQHKSKYGINWENAGDRKAMSDLDIGDDVYNLERERIGLPPMFKKNQKMAFAKKTGISLVFF